MMKLGMPAERRVTRRNGVRVLLLADGYTLLLADSDPGVPGSRFWTLPGGGIDAGESIRAAALREVFEETGLALAEADLEGPVATRLVTHRYSDRVLIQHETIFRAHTDLFVPDPQGLTLSEMRRGIELAWHRLDALPEPIWPAQIATLAYQDPAVVLDLGEVDESSVD